jgi:glycine betaine/proline transport system permease protein
MPSVPRIELGDWVAEIVRWLQSNASPVWDAIRWLLLGPTQTLEDILLFLPASVMAVLAAVLAWRLRGWRFGLFTLGAFLLMDGMNMWSHAMKTVALITVATLVAVSIAVPVGIMAARHRLVSSSVRPLLDFMQTLPAFVYLIPAIFFFRIGIVPGLVATLVFAIPPGIRLTELGIRQVDAEVVEAAQAFGATRNQVLLRVQLPLALPTIMAGVNQVIMLALSMVVIAGMVGAGGLGGEVVRAIQRLNVSLGVEAGLSVVIVAIFLDRITEAIGRKVDPSRLASAH